MYDRPSTPYRPRKTEAIKQYEEQATSSSSEPVRKAPRSASDLHAIAVFKTWKRNIPGITRENAILLSASGSERNKRLLNLPFFLLLKVAGYLCGPGNPGQPLEWLIISALFQIYALKPRDQAAILLDAAEQKLILQTMFTTLFSKNPSPLSNPLAVKAVANEEWLLEAVKKESAALIGASATRATVALLDKDNEGQLDMVMLFGTYVQKNMTIYYLMSTLFNTYYACHYDYETPGRKAEHQSTYTATSRYLTFMQTHRTQEWVDTLQTTLEENSFENLLKIRHSGYLWNAEKTVRDKAPPSPFHTETSTASSSNKKGIREPLLSNPPSDHQEPTDAWRCCCTIS